MRSWIAVLFAAALFGSSCVFGDDRIGSVFARSNDKRFAFWSSRDKRFSFDADGVKDVTAFGINQLNDR